MGAVGVAQAAAPVGDATAGQAKAAACGACHGMDGNSLVPNFPKLAGQHADYIANQLKAFKAGSKEGADPKKTEGLRQDPTMAPQAANLTDQDMADIAAYFNSQKRSVGSANAEKGALGAKIYRGGIAAKSVSACMGCHGPSGAGNPPVFPGLNGQQAAYVGKALRDFKTGVRTTDANKMMRDIAVKMSEEEIDQVAEFISGLH
jgi:cytochrome c553